MVGSVTLTLLVECELFTGPLNRGAVLKCIRIQPKDLQMVRILSYNPKVGYSTRKLEGSNWRLSAQDSMLSRFNATDVNISVIVSISCNLSKGLSGKMIHRRAICMQVPRNISLKSLAFRSGRKAPFFIPSSIIFRKRVW